MQSGPQTAVTEAMVEAVLARFEDRDGPLLPALHAVQQAFGHIPRSATAPVATRFNLSRAEVRGVISFYHEFRETPPGRHVLQLCRAEACQSVGAVALAREVLAQLGIAWGETTADGSLTLEPVFCLGLCACGPAALLDGEPLGRLTATRLTEIAAACAREEAS